MQPRIDILSHSNNVLLWYSWPLGCILVNRDTSTRLIMCFHLKLPYHKYLCWFSFSWYVPITYRGPRNKRGNPTALYYNSNNSAMFLARENKKSKTYLQLMSFIQLTKTTNIYILHENKECMELHNTLLHNIIILIIFNIA